MGRKTDYIYTNRNGTPLYKQVRVQNEEGKTFFGEKYVDRKWEKGLDGVERVLYNLPSIIKAVENKANIYFVEGEKDVETLKEKGLVATTIAGGVNGKIPQDLADTLSSADIIIIPDNDKVGKEFAMKIANILTEKSTVKILDLTKKWKELKEKGDITDVFEMVNNDETVLKMLEELAEETPAYQVSEETKLSKGEVKKKDKDQVYKDKILLGDKEIEVEVNVPRGYKIENNGMFFEKRIDKDTKIWIKFSPCTVLIKSILENMKTDEQRIELLFYKPNKKEWKVLSVDKNIINNKQNIVTLGNKGLPITSSNSSMWVDFLASMEQANYDTIKTAYTIDRLGWVNDKIFMPYIKGNVVLDMDENSLSWLKGFRQSGSIENWVKLMKPFRENNVFRAVLASAFVPPLLRYIDSRTFIVNLWGPSKSGKSASLLAALSAFGNPEELKVTFNGTLVGFERLISLLSDIVIRCG